MATTVTLGWDPPQGSGPQTIVDNYTISISPVSPYQLERILISSSPWNITLQHNEVYSINLTAMNCAGESELAILFGVGFSEFIYQFTRGNASHSEKQAKRELAS